LTVSEIQHGETDNVEFKMMEPDEDRKFLKTVAAFSNCSGGTVVFGVKNGTREIICIPEDSVFTVMDGIADSISDNISPQIIPSITFQTITNRTIVVVQIYPGQNTPYYLKSEGVLNGTYIRVGATTRKAENEKVQEFILRGTHQSYDELFQNTEPADRTDINTLCSVISRYNREQTRSVTVENLVSWKLLREEGNGFIPSIAFRLQ
jgi:ATP-dependent DNA helicase RecG